MFLTSFFSRKFGNAIFKKRYEEGMYDEVADVILRHTKAGRVLDVGTGGGFLLKSLYDRNPNLELYAIDIDENMVRISQSNLLQLAVPATVLLEGIENTSFRNDFFNVITCSASFSYWKNPIAGLNEIHRILKLGGRGILFEPYKELDIEKLKTGIKNHLKSANKVRRFFAVQVNVLGLKYGHRLGLKLYSLGELEEVLNQSLFKNSHKLVKTSLINSPIFVRIELEKINDD